MGKCTVESEAIFAYPPEAIYDFVSDPSNWARTYRGEKNPYEHLQIPLEPGDRWEERVFLKHNTYQATWTLITAVRPRKWAFQQIDKIGMKEDGSGGVEGIVTISYTFESSPGHGMTIFTRSLCCELARGVDIPDDLLAVMCRLGGADKYHAAIEKELSEKMRWKAENEETRPSGDGREMYHEEAVRGHQLFDIPVHSNNDQKDHVGIRSKGKGPKSSKASVSGLYLKSDSTVNLVR